jgi:1-acyl-sn-glycerol-3-phosphate acyltransferase
LTRRLAEIFLRLRGWDLEGQKPQARRYVLVAAPHTTNWDLAYLLALASVTGVRLSWMGKNELFRGPMGPAMRRLGGVPVRRDRRTDLVEQMVQAFEANPSLVLTIAPEATRSRASHWKSGFYRIAVAARVPIVLGFLDYARRRGGFGPEIHPCGDLRADMERIRDFYADKTGKYPDQFGAVRLLEEAEAAPAGDAVGSMGR